MHRNRRFAGSLSAAGAMGLCVCAAAFSQRSSDDGGTITPVARFTAIVERLPHVDELTTAFTVEIFKPVAAGDPLPETPLESRNYELVVDGIRRVVVEHIAAAPDGSHPVADLHGAWNGRLWMSQGRHGQFAIDSSQPHGLVTDCWAMFHGIDMPSALGWRLSRIVAFGEVVDDKTIGDDCVIHAWMNEGRSTHVEIVFTGGDEPRLKSFRKDVYGQPDHAGGRARRLSLCYVVEEWGEYEGHILPRRAHRDVTMFAVGERVLEPPQVSRTTFTRQSAAFAAHPDVTMPGPAGDARIRDATLRATYTLGGSRISLDGVEFSTTQPIAAIVREELPSLIGAPIVGLSMPPEQHWPDDQPAFRVAERSVLLSIEQPTTVIVTALGNDDTTAPRDVQCFAPPGVTWRFTGWRLLYGADESTNRPARWHGLVEIESQAATLAPDAAIEVRLADHPPQRVNLTGRS